MNGMDLESVPGEPVSKDRLNGHANFAEYVLEDAWDGILDSDAPLKSIKIEMRVIVDPSPRAAVGFFAKAAGSAVSGDRLPRLRPVEWGIQHRDKADLNPAIPLNIWAEVYRTN